MADKVITIPEPTQQALRRVSVFMDLNGAPETVLVLMNQPAARNGEEEASISYAQLSAEARQHFEDFLALAFVKAKEETGYLAKSEAVAEGEIV